MIVVVFPASFTFSSRTGEDVDFYRDRSSNKNGFGSLIGDFWLRNDAIHTLTDQHPCELRVDILYEHQPYFAVFPSFRIEDEASIDCVLAASPEQRVMVNRICPITRINTFPHSIVTMIQIAVAAPSDITEPGGTKIAITLI
ncbi:hypothetical protein RRG08_039252 [Elysia crispata]|uniref:Fibrinogen C-terminal domain-containing protein n=1 Tax=Elysia crispata TaxID=231223 RepID=A0AAE1DJQ2_9GAST|nr:hypothetical protein RRG08_039252 [Elysia crispata]